MNNFLIIIIIASVTFLIYILIKKWSEVTISRKDSYPLIKIAFFIFSGFVLVFGWDYLILNILNNFLENKFNMKPITMDKWYALIGYIILVIAMVILYSRSRKKKESNSIKVRDSKKVTIVTGKKNKVK